MSLRFLTRAYLAGVQRRDGIVAHLISSHPYSATIPEIGAAVGLSSSSSVWHHLQKLIEAGIVVSRGKGTVGFRLSEKYLARVTPRPASKFVAPKLVPCGWIL